MNPIFNAVFIFIQTDWFLIKFWFFLSVLGEFCSHTLPYKFSFIFYFSNNTNGHILKITLSWSPTWAKSCQLIASLSVVLSQLNLTKLELKYLKSGFKYKKKDINTDENFLHRSSSTFFRVQLKFLDYGRKYVKRQNICEAVTADAKYCTFYWSPITVISFDASVSLHINISLIFTTALPCSHIPTWQYDTNIVLLKLVIWRNSLLLWLVIISCAACSV